MLWRDDWLAMLLQDEECWKYSISSRIVSDCQKGIRRGTSDFEEDRPYRRSRRHPRPPDRWAYYMCS